MAFTTTTQVPYAVNNFFSRMLLSRAYPLFVHTRWAQVQDIPKNDTNIIKFRKYNSLSAATTALNEGVTPTGSQLSLTDITATVLQYGDFITTTDLLKWTVIEDIDPEIADILGDQAGDTLDQLTRDILAAGTTYQYVQGVAGRTSIATGMILTGDEIRKAVRTLHTNNAKHIKSQINASTGFNTTPVHDCYVGIISEKTLYDLKKDPDWVPVEEYSSQGDIMEGEQGKLDEVRFVLAGSNAKVFAAGGAGSIDVHATLIIGREAYGISRIAGESMETIIKPLGSGGTEDPLNQRSTVGWKATFVAKILQQAFMIRIEHAVSA